ncbi:MAG: hypothetical protein ACRD04_14590 [Terriglobales bacterium]
MTAAQILDAVAAVGGALGISERGGILWRLPTDAQPRLLPEIRRRKTDLLVLLRRPEVACPACSLDIWRQGDAGGWFCPVCSPEALDLVFGVLPTDPEEAAAEQALRAKLREPQYARVIISQPVIVMEPISASLRVIMIAAASAVWAAGAPEELARRRAAAWVDIPLQLIAGRRVSFLPAPNGLVPGEWCRTPHGAACELLARDADSDGILVRALADPPRWAWFAPTSLTSELDWPPDPAPAPKAVRRDRMTVCPKCRALAWYDATGGRRCDCDGSAAAERERWAQ